MPYHEAPGATIYYESVGQGPLLLCISGADGSCECWREFARRLNEHFTVVMWDRRGFSRSQLHKAQAPAQRLQIDADDAARLIQLLSPDGTATIIGNSSGAIVALKLLVSHPQLIRTLLSYEPPLASVLPDFDSLWPRQEAVYTTYRRWGILPAMKKFTTLTKSGPSQIAKVIITRSRPSTNVFSNTRYWFEGEFLNYPQASFDVDRELLPLKAKLVLLNGEKTNREAYQWRANELIATKLGLNLQIFPGEHLGHMTHAKLFASKFLEVVGSRPD